MPHTIPTTPSSITLAARMTKLRTRLTHLHGKLPYREEQWFAWTWNQCLNDLETLAEQAEERAKK